MPVVKNKLNKWSDWLVDHVPKPIKNTVSKVLKAKNSKLSLYDGAKKTLKDVGKDTEKGNQKQTEDKADLTPQQHEKTLKGVYKYFVVPELSKGGIGGYNDQVKPHIKTLIASQLKKM